MELISKVYDEILSFNVSVEGSIKKISKSQLLIADFFNTKFKTEIDNVLIKMAKKNNSEIDNISKTLIKINKTLNDDEQYKKLEQVSDNIDNLKESVNNDLNKVSKVFIEYKDTANKINVSNDYPRLDLRLTYCNCQRQN